MNLLDSFGKEKLPSVLKDPFTKSKVTSINVNFAEPFWSGEKEWKSDGTVYFKNGDTKGQQSFKAVGEDAFDQVVLQIRSFLKSLD